MNRVSEQQQRLNVQSCDGWDRYAAHRAHVMDHLTRGQQGGNRRLCVLGAGNCNDVDLPALLSAFREVHLVDLDGDALRGAAMRQACQTQRGLHQHIADVTGIADQLGRWPTVSTPPAQRGFRRGLPLALPMSSLPITSLAPRSRRKRCCSDFPVTAAT